MMQERQILRVPDIYKLTQNNFVKNKEHAEQLSTKYGIPVEDVILTAFNLSGVETSEIAEDRVRFKLKLDSYADLFFSAICVNTRKTSFELRGSRIYFAGESMGTVFDLERDTCDRSYMRRGNTSLNLNSNARSTCRGCKICGTYSQEADDLHKLSSEERVVRHLEEIFAKYGLADASELFGATICTGCFGTEERAVNHILMVNRVLKDFGFAGILRYLGSEITSEQGIDIIQAEVDNFALSITTEVFTRRQKMLKQVKARVDLEQMKQVLADSIERGFRANIVYVLGLDPLEEVVRGFEDFAPYMNEFPIINLFQNYLPTQENLRDPSARNIDYYLTTRKELERIYQPTGLRPRTWENYRPLWYTTFADEDLHE